ncbi:MAG: FKBP-type peptidyl-prolyl cis-trans isomerase [Erythrobacter sp.]|jgi:FKBP-type peptidyl-prolyl cis-trans isomerase FkpA|nr:FKBP-type peptidyl-prolyl cis-trans isomerase [Erythrobacter sp.]
MTEITRVPLKPVAKGSLTKLWVGIALAILAGAALAWAAMPAGPRSFEVVTIEEGEGPFAQEGEIVFVKYSGALAETGEVFDQSRPVQLPVQGIFPEEGSPFPVEANATIEGFYKGLQQMRKGGKYELFIPAEMAYGAEPPPGAPIPPDADLVFDMEVVEIMSQAQFDRNIQILQQALQAPGGLGAPQGAPQGAPPGGVPGGPGGF